MLLEAATRLAAYRGPARMEDENIKRVKEEILRGLILGPVIDEKTLREGVIPDLTDEEVDGFIDAIQRRGR